MAHDDRVGDLDLRTADADQINERMTLGAIDALRAHKVAGRSVVVWDRDRRQVVEIPADEIVLSEESESIAEPAPRGKTPVR